MAKTIGFKRKIVTACEPRKLTVPAPFMRLARVTPCSIGKTSNNAVAQIENPSKFGRPRVETAVGRRHGG